MTTSSPQSSGSPTSGRGAEPAAPTPLDVAAAFDASPVGRGPGAAPPRSSRASAGDGEDLADRVVAAVLAVPGVVRLHAGAFGEVATYLPRRAVTGVRLRPDEAEVHLVVSAGRPIPEVAGNVHEAVRALVPGPVHLFVEDVESPPTRSPAP
ncbi:Asp23/Gls24 family envelope stress response protein [Oerskovia enterophila]|uniref:Asp23/Gls24 family envelope stress response protein n=1 Tax=Oerskovia enterophila TaxID=43678 RepID=UPI0033964856